MNTSRDDIFVANRSPNPLEETMERVAGTIRARLFNPGDRLPPERELAVQLGVSRSTLRVALQALEQAGWIEVRRGRHGGSFITRWPSVSSTKPQTDALKKHLETLPSLLDYRRAVETATAGFAAERASAEDIDELKQINETLRGQQGNFEAQRSGDARLHIGIARAAHSPRLMEAVTEVQSALAEVLDMVVSLEQADLNQVVGTHDAIIEAIGQRDSDTSRDLMLKHVIRTEQLISRLVSHIS